MVRNNLSLFIDFYELAMSASYLKFSPRTVATFNLFIRTLPPVRSFYIVCHIEDIINSITNFRFSDDDLKYLKSLKKFPDEFIEYLSGFRFNGDVYSIEDGTVVFPEEPVVVVTAPIIEAQILETLLLNIVNINTTLLSKSIRVVIAAKGKPVYDFSPRRTQGIEAGLKSAKFSYIAGCAGTSNVLAGKKFGIPVVGTMAHSYVMAFESELEAFRSFAKTFPDNAILLIDTYDVYQGTKNAIIVAKELEKNGKRLLGVRIDSGDVVKLSKTVRKMLNDNGLGYVKIILSGNLDEYKIDEILKSSTPVDAFGVGTNMGVSTDLPYTDVVYKIVEISDHKGRHIPVMKLSRSKVTYPCKKQVYRVIRGNTYYKDIISLSNEKISGIPLLHKVIEGGKIVYKPRPINEIRDKVKNEISMLPDEMKDITRQHKYRVEISPHLKRITKKIEEKLRTGT